MNIPVKYLSEQPGQCDYLALTTERFIFHNGERVRLCYVFDEHGNYQYGRYVSEDLLHRLFTFDLDVKKLDEQKEKMLLWLKYIDKGEEV